MTSNPMLEAAERLKQLRDQKDDLEDQVKLLNLKIKEADKELSDMMAEAETPNFTHAGFMYVMTTKIRASAKEGLKADLFAALRENGAGDMIQETVNPNTLSSYVKEQMDDNRDEIPDWLKPLVTVYPQTGVSVRKATRN